MRAASSIETHKDRDVIDADIRAGTPIRAVAAQWGIGIGTVARRKRALEKVAAAAPTSSIALPPAAPAPAPTPAPTRHEAPATDPILKPVAPEPGPSEDDLDQIEEQYGEPHTRRLQHVAMFMALGKSHKEIGGVLGRSERTIQRWAHEAKVRKIRAVNPKGARKQIAEAIWTFASARTEVLQSLFRSKQKGNEAGVIAAARELRANASASAALWEKLSAGNGEGATLIGSEDSKDRPVGLLRNPYYTGAPLTYPVSGEPMSEKDKHDQRVLAIMQMVAAGVLAGLEALPPGADNEAARGEVIDRAINAMPVFANLIDGKAPNGAPIERPDDDQDHDLV